MRKILVLFLGRSIDGILADAKDAFGGDHELVVVKRDGDQLAPPSEIADCVIATSDFRPEPGVEYTVVANGGTSAQLLPVVKRLVDAGVMFQAFDLQRDGAVRVW